jgi:hypothetical protein
VPNNDVVLLDSLVADARRGDRFGRHRQEDEVFELFCFDSILRKYDVTYEDIQDGWVDGANDSGVDGMFVLLDGVPVKTSSVAQYAGANPELDLIIITVKRHEGFKETPVSLLAATLPRLLDLRTPVSQFRDTCNELLRSRRELFREVFAALASKHVHLRIRVLYACRGDTRSISANTSGRAEQLRETLKSQFGRKDEISVELLGAAELLELARATRTYSHELAFVENHIARSSEDYLLLTTLMDFYAFITEDNKDLRRHLFDGNLRDFLGDVQVNNDIMASLAGGRKTKPVDFWWLNNGITILASSARTVGKKIVLENAQIVNGLQTAECIYKHFRRVGAQSDTRALLVKVLVTDDPEVRDRVAKATNYQNAVERASLRARDKIQRDIEQYLESFGWYYDRRRNHHKNLGKPADRILSMSYLGAAITALALRDPAGAANQKTKFMQQDVAYRRVFNPKWELSVFRGCVEIQKAVDIALRRIGERLPGPFAHHVAYLYACGLFSTADYNVNQIGAITECAVDEKLLAELVRFLSRSKYWYEQGDGRTRKAKANSRAFVDAMVKSFEGSSFMPSAGGTR